jgi:hypothetical protein
MPDFPRDRFDDVPDDLLRVGAHRTPARRGRAWVWIGWTALVSGLLVGAGVLALMVQNGTLPFFGDGDTEADGSSSSASADPSASGASPSETPTEVSPITDPSALDPALATALTVTVLNGTTQAGLAASVGEQLTDIGWPVGATSNASSSDVGTTTVYYTTPDYEGVARGIVEQLGAGTVAASDSFEAPVTVVIGADLAD